MKRINGLIVTMLAFALLTGCSPDGDEHISQSESFPGAEYPYSMRTQLGWATFAESDSGYYFFVPKCLFYMDKDSMEPVVLCDKPNCLHYDEPDVNVFRTCKAYFNSTISWDYTSWYDGNVYILAKSIVDIPEEKRHAMVWEVVCISPDGSNRKTVWRIGEDIIIDGMAISHGYLYLAMSGYGEDAKGTGSIWQLSLKKVGAQPKRIFETEKVGIFKSVDFLNAYMGQLYFFRTIDESGETELCILEPQSGDLTTISVTEDGFSPLYALFQGSYLLLECRIMTPQGDPMLPDSYPQRLYRCSLDGNGMELLREGLGYYTADDRYIYMVEDLDQAERPEPCVRIYDGNMNEVDCVDLQHLDTGDSIGLISCTASRSDQVILELSCHGDSGTYVECYWFEKNEIGSGQIKLHQFFEYDFQRYSSANR